MRVSIIGAGIVGSATGIGFHQHGNEVVFCDIDSRKLSSLRKRGYKTTKSIEEAVELSDVSFVCIQTPVVKGRIILNWLKKATEQIGEALHRQNRGFHVVAIRSTVLPTTTRTKLIPLLQKHSRLEPGIDFGTCMNPEFLRRSSSFEDFMNPKRIVIGELNKQSGDVLEKLYSFSKAPRFRTNLDAAEMIKFVSNLFLASKISFFNEIYSICRKNGLDPRFISHVVSLDDRIGAYGINGGKAFEGCLSKDLESFISFSKDKGLNPRLLSAVYRINKNLGLHDSI